eukprot:9770462-Ditylum_brightwellii.AAC.1
MCSLAKKTLRYLDRSVRRVVRLYDFYLDGNEQVRKVRHAVRAKKRDKKGPRTMVCKYGVEVPQGVKHALELDKANGNTMWQDTMALEVDALKEMECFDFQDAGNKPAGNYQHTTLHMVFDCKQDLRKRLDLWLEGI